MKTITFSIQNERGTIILAVLMILLALSVLGIAAIITTTTENQVSGNYRLQNDFFYGSDGARRKAGPATQAVLEGGTIPPEVTDGNLLNELLGVVGSGDTPDLNPDLTVSLGASISRVDIDRMAARSAGGSATQFASGYEGIGMSAASGGTVITYQVDSIAGLGISEAQTSHVYNLKVQ